MSSVLHLSRTPVAGSPAVLSRVLNKYSDWESYIHSETSKIGIADYTSDYEHNIPFSQLQKHVNAVDLLHFHNVDQSYFSGINFKNKPYLLQLHSEPRVRGHLLKKHPNKCVTIAQKQACLYQDLLALPNLVLLLEEANTTYNDVINVLYSPTSRIQLNDYRQTCQGKGYAETLQVLKLLEKKFQHQITVRVVEKLPKEEVMALRLKADILIDECITGGYHRTSLEGLACGTVVVANLMKQVKDIICKVSGSAKEALPWAVCRIEQLEECLTQLIDLFYTDRQAFEGLKLNGKKWMQTYWNPELLVNKYTEHYKQVLNAY